MTCHTQGVQRHWETVCLSTRPAKQSPRITPAATAQSLAIPVLYVGASSASGASQKTPGWRAAFQPPQGGQAASRCADVSKGAVASAVRAESDSGSLHCLLLHPSCSFDISRQARQGKHREPAQRPTTPTLVSSEKFYRKGCTSFSSALTKQPQEAGGDLQGPFQGDFHFQGPSRNWSHMN